MLRLHRRGRHRRHRARPACIPALHAQAPAAPPAAPAAAPQGRGNQPPPVNSQEVLADRKITFRIYAPNAQAVRLVGR